MRSIQAVSAVALLLPSLALTSLPAFAGMEKIEKPVGATDVTAAISVELLADPSGGSAPLVWATLGDGEDAQPCMVEIVTGKLSSEISPGQIEKLALKAKAVKVKGGEFKAVTIPTLSVGDASFTDLQAIEAEDLGDACLRLSLPATGLAWALTPSQGKLHLAPAAQGAAMLALVDGVVVPYSTTPPATVKYGKMKLDLPGGPHRVQGNIGGHDVSIYLGTGLKTNLSADLELTGDAVKRKGDQVWTWSPITIGGNSMAEAWVKSESSWRVVSGGSPDAVTSGAIGNDLLDRYDMASDAAGKLALKRADNQERHDQRAVLLTQAQADLDKCLNPEEPLEGDAAELSAGERCSAQYGGVASAALVGGKLKESLTARQVIADAAPGKCDSWTAVGELQLALGKTDDAATSFEKAATQYHAWWDIDAWDRTESKKAFDALEEDQQKTAAVQPQSNGCYVADGMLALAWLAQGKADAVADLHAARTDMDPGLPSVYGSHLIMEDDVEAAHGPWRMVDHLNLSPSMAAKAGLGRLFAQQRDWDSAWINYQAALNIDDEDATVVAMWVDDMVVGLGADAALDEARKWAAKRPDSLAARFGVARAARAGAKDPGFLTKDADPLFVLHSELAPLDVNGLATWARYLTATGRLARAKKTVERAIATDPSVANAWLAKAELQLAEGNPGAAKASMMRAAQAGGQHPGYALLLEQAR